MLELAERRAIPRVARVTHELLDEWGRRSHTALLDSCRELTASLSAPLTIGASYIYLGGVPSRLGYDVEIEHMSRHGEIIVVMGRDTVDGPPDNVRARRRFTNVWQPQDGG